MTLQGAGTSLEVDDISGISQETHILCVCAMALQGAGTSLVVDDFWF